ncbi:MAG: hypothetical protein PHT84_02110 [Candidatus Pacebacteria bacterium]|nr:hypothetical protein [Candidatus Paceibacterota bacterium]
MFVPERIKITGIIIGTKKEKSSFCWPPMGENDHFFTPLDLVKVTDYYVVVKSNQYELPVTIKVSKDLFNSVSKNQEIAIECKKFSWKKDTDYEEIKMHITF